MSNQTKFLPSVLSGGSDQNLSFDQLIKLLLKFGFQLRIKGSHHIFVKKDIEEIVNLQANGNKAKAYQVKQVRNLIVKYQLNLE